MKKQISILGCGWLGFSLAKFLISKDYKIKGSTTSPNKLEVLKRYTIDSYIINLTEASVMGDISGFLSESETLIVNIPPGLRKNPNKNHVSEIKNLINSIEKEQVDNVLYISSTGVFKDEEHLPKITKTSKPNNTVKGYSQLIEIEQMLLENSNFSATILRFGGLFDDKRHPAKYLSGRINIANPNAPINLIHKNDCINIIHEILKKDIWNLALNAVFPIHTDKKSYYKDYCKRYNLEEPNFNLKNKSVGKIIDSSHLEQLLNYSFKLAP